MTRTLDGSPLGIDDVVAVARGGEAVRLTDEVLVQLGRWRSGIESMVTSGEPVDTP